MSNLEDAPYIRYITIKQLSKVANVKESWIRRQILLRRIPYLKFGRLIRFELNAVIEWIHGNK